jgi:hypothetical protein
MQELKLQEKEEKQMQVERNKRNAATENTSERQSYKKNS